MTPKLVVARLPIFFCLVLAVGCGRSAIGEGHDSGARPDAKAGQSDGTAGGPDGAVPDGMPTADAPPDSRVPDTAMMTGDAGDAGSTMGDTPPPVVMLLGIDVTPAVATAAAGTLVSFVATGRFSDGSTLDLTGAAIWTSSVPGVATVSAGVAKGLTVGMTTIKAEAMGFSGSAALTVSAATITSLTIEPLDPRIPVATKQAFTATGIFSDGSKQDVTGQAIWNSSDSMVATVAAGGTASGLRAGTTTISATLGTTTGKTLLTVTPATLVEIDVTPTNPSLPLPGSARFTATGLYSDGSNLDLTTSVSWESSDRTVLSISSAAGTQGFAMSVSSGTSIVTARLGGVSGVTTVTVLKATLISIKVSPESASVPRGATQSFRATGTYSDGTMLDVTSSVAWSAVDEKIAAVSNAGGTQGVATALALGATQIVATQGGLAGASKITVTDAVVTSLSIAPRKGSLPVGRQQPYTATATYSDNSQRDVTGATVWSVTDGAVAAISNAAGSAGTLTGLKVGSTSVTGVFAGKSDTVPITISDAVLDSITVKPNPVTLVAGLKQSFTAVGNYSDGSSLDLTVQVTWASDDTAIATVSNAVGIKGQATGVAPGTTGIHARLDGKDGAAKLTITAPTLTAISVAPIAPGRRVGENIQFGASAISSNGTSQNVTLQAAWATSNPAVATINSMVNPRGRATCVGVGTATITATYMGLSDSTTLTCTSPTLVEIQVTPFLATVLVGQRQPMNAAAIFSDGTSINVTNMATWVSSNTNVADVSNGQGRGSVLGVAAGTATITATYMGLQASATVTVNDATLVAISVSPILVTLQVGQTQQYQATAIFSDGSTRNATGMATWSSSDTTVADVTNIGGRGQATALKPGTVTIIATFMGLTDSGILIVSGAKLTGLSVSPINARILVGQTVQYQAVALYEDGSSLNVTGQTLWASTDTAVADISNAAGGGGRGQAAGLKAGSVTISGTYMGFSDSTQLTVSAATLTSVSVTPLSAALLVGQGQAFQLVAIYSDGTSQNVTGASSWVSSNPKVADVSNGGGGRGQVTALASGSAIITATFGGLSDTAKVTVSAAAMKSISVTPVSNTMAVGDVAQYQAVALYEDNSTQNVTGIASWTSSDASVADVSNGPGRGQVSALKAGTATITAKLSGLSGSADLTVSSATLTSIQVTPVNATLPKGAAQQYTAIGLYSDASTRNLTAQVTWLGSNDTVASVSNAAGSRGQLTAVGEGVAVISATLGPVTAKTNVTVSAAVITEIQVTPTNPWILIGGAQQLVATAVYSDYSVQNITGLATWSSASTQFAQVSNAGGTRGRVSGVGSGTSSISATYMGISGATVVTVTSAMIKEIQIAPTNPRTPVGLRTQFQATAVLTDAATLDVTATATWTSSDESVATVSNVGARGLGTALKPGTSTIRATLGGLFGSTVYTVGAETLASIAVTAPSSTLAKGATQQYTATGTYSDKSTFDLTPYVTWISTASAVATVSNASGSRGLATGVAAGKTSIEAHMGGVTGAAGLTVP